MCVKFLKVYVFKGYIVRSVMIGCILLGYLFFKSK
jgi:hypothetical protein